MPILGILASSTRVAAGDFESIATVTVGAGGASNVEFTSISGTYTHLQIRCFNIINSNDINGRLQFNSDTGSNYATHQIYGDGSTTAATATSSTTSILTVISATSGTNPTGVAIIDILDYANTNKYKTVRTLGGSDTNGAGYIIFRSGLWMNTNAITSLKISTSAGLFNQYSHFALYGIKSA